MEQENEVLRGHVREAREKEEKTREKYLREIASLREVGYQMGRGNSNFVEYLNVHFFDASDGLDPPLVDILNRRVQLMKSQFESNLNELRAKCSHLAHKIELYKQLAPPSYPLIETPLESLFKQLALIEPDPLIVWKALQSVYPAELLREIIGVGGETSSKEIQKLEMELMSLGEEWKAKWEDMKEHYQEELHIARKESMKWMGQAEEIETEARQKLEEAKEQWMEEGARQWARELKSLSKSELPRRIPEQI